MAELNDSLKQTDELLASIVKSLSSAEQISKRLEGSMGGVASKAKSAKGGGDRHIGSGNNNQMPHMGKTTFSGEEKANSTAEVAMREGMEATRYGLQPTRAAKVLGVAQGVAQATFGIAAGVMAAVPGVAEVGASAANYYGASVRSGGMSRTSIMNATFSGLAGGVTSTLSPSNIAGILSSRGVMPGSAQYEAIVGEIGGAARYLNMANENAAVAMSGMTQGSMSAKLYGLGISTFDSTTGKARGPNEINEQIYGRLTQGQKKMTAEQTANSIQAGIFGKTMTDLGMTDDQRNIFGAYATDRAKGISPELAGKGYGDNPMKDKMRITTSDTSVLNAYTDPVLKGFKAAADLIVTTVNPALKNMADVAGVASGFLGGIGESRAGTGIGIAVGGILAGVQTIVTLLAAGAVMKGGAALAGGMAAGGMAAGVAGAGVAVAGGGAGYLTGKGGKALGNKLGTSQTVTRVGSVAASAGTGALAGAAIGSIVPVLGTGVGAVIGGVAGGIGGFFGSGGGSPGFGAAFGGGGVTNSNPASPISGANIGTPYGASGSMWSGGTHTGQDYPCAIGTPVRASLDGIIISTSPGADYGKTVEIDHGNGYQTLYGHLSEVLVSVGATVVKGQIIARSGDTGKVTGPHLHYEVRKGKNNPVNPNELQGGGLDGVLTGTSGSSVSGLQINDIALSKEYGSPSLLGLAESARINPLGNHGGKSGASTTSNRGQGSYDPMPDGSLVATLKAAGFTGEALSIAYGVAKAESGGRSNAKSHPSLLKDDSYGLFQINMLGDLGPARRKTHGLSSNEDLYDPATNARVAYAISKGGTNWSPWSAYTNGRYKERMGPSGGGSPSVATPSMGSSEGLNISPSITINVSVQKASYAEAMQLVDIVKTQLQKDSLLKLVGQR